MKNILICLLLNVLLAGCGSTAPEKQTVYVPKQSPVSTATALPAVPPAVAPVAATRSAQAADIGIRTRWHVVLAAVGNEQKVFDNFVSDFSKVFTGHSDVASITELHASSGKRWPASGMKELRSALAKLKPQQGEGCLIYLTGHGSPDGIGMSAEKSPTSVSPTQMEFMLSPCEDRPTILVMSACFSGVYMRPPMMRPERIVLTASANNVPSFGCSNNNHYTFFDQCFIDAWPRHNSWGLLADDIGTCVDATEKKNNFPKSNPQVFFGPNMRTLALPGL